MFNQIFHFFNEPWIYLILLLIIILLVFLLCYLRYKCSDHSSYELHSLCQKYYNQKPIKEFYV